MQVTLCDPDSTTPSDFLRQARYDRDHLERNYTRILNGLQEHEAMILPLSPSKNFVAVPLQSHAALTA